LRQKPRALVISTAVIPFGPRATFRDGACAPNVRFGGNAPINPCLMSFLAIISGAYVRERDCQRADEGAPGF
jgi:hypothetical protein